MTKWDCLSLDCGPNGKTVKPTGLQSRVLPQHGGHALVPKNIVVVDPVVVVHGTDNSRESSEVLAWAKVCSTRDQPELKRFGCYHAHKRQGPYLSNSFLEGRKRHISR